MGAPEFYDNGQAVKAPIWAIKDLDPGQKRIN